MGLNNRKRKNKIGKKEKAITYLKLILVGLSITLIGAFLYLGVNFLKQKMPVKRIELKGNQHHGDRKLINLMKIRKDHSLLFLSLKDLAEKLKNDPWIKNVYLRKILPSTIVVEVKEATPMAYIFEKNYFYLIDEDGLPLAKTRNRKFSSLPIFTSMTLKRDRKKIREAIALLKALQHYNVFSSKNTMRIHPTKSYGLVMEVNGVVVRIGYGNYSEKLKRWLQASSEVKKLNLKTVYLDVRFKNQVIVKPAQWIQ